MFKFKSFLQVVSLVLIACLMLNLSGAQAAGSSGTAFTYQGQLKDGSGNPITNTCDFQFGLYAALSGGSPVTGTTVQTLPSVAVTNGYFTVSLDFGAGAFDGNARWLEISVSCPAGGSYVTLSPRQALTAAPYAIFAVNADLLDGQHAAAFQQHSQNVRVVAKSGGDYTTITDALNSITDASASNPYLIYVAPGVYTETVTMKAWVDIEGAGELVTKITYAGSSGISTGTVVGANNSELRFLTVVNTGGTAFATTIYNSSASPRLTHITATAMGGTTNYGVYNHGTSPMMTNVTASASGGSNSYGVYNSSASSPTMANINATASGGTNCYGVYNAGASSPTMTNVTASVSVGNNIYGVYNSGASSPVMTNMTASASGGSNSYGVYNSGASSPTMTNVRVTASGGGYNHGVYNDSSSPTMTNLTVSASGVGSNYGVYNYASSPTITSMTATASGGTNNYGMWNTNSSPTIQGSVITGSGGTSDGIHNAGGGTGPFTVIINNSQVAGGSSTIYTEVATYTTKVGASQLQGIGGQGLGTYKCVSSYNGNFDPLGATTCR